MVIAIFARDYLKQEEIVEHGLVTLEHFGENREMQNEALRILQFKLDVLWSMLDAIQTAYGIGEGRIGIGEKMPDEQ